MNNELLQKAAAYCSVAERCVSDVREKLTLWLAKDSEDNHLNTADIESIIDYLLKEKYIDETRYCRAFVNDKLRFAKWGRQKINYMLQVKHVDKAAIREAIDAIDEEIYLDVLEDVLRTKKKSLRSVESEQVNIRLYRFAASRGFETSEISKVLKRIKE